MNLGPVAAEGSITETEHPLSVGCRGAPREPGARGAARPPFDREPGPLLSPQRPARLLRGGEGHQGMWSVHSAEVG